MQEQFATATLLWSVLAGQGRQESAGSVRERYVPAGQAKGGNIQVLRTTLIEALVSRSRLISHGHLGAEGTCPSLFSEQAVNITNTYTFILNLSPHFLHASSLSD